MRATLVAIGVLFFFVLGVKAAFGCSLEAALMRTFLFVPVSAICLVAGVFLRDVEDRVRRP